jgi:hypothetical protein
MAWALTIGGNGLESPGAHSDYQSGKHNQQEQTLLLRGSYEKVPGTMEDVRKRNWFLIGMALAALLTAPLLRFLPEIANQKQTGLGAVAGGVSEIFFTLGIVTTLLLTIGTIALLGRSFSKNHLFRTLLASAAIAWSALLLVWYGFGAWTIFQYRR